MLAHDSTQGMQEKVAKLERIVSGYCTLLLEHVVIMRQHLPCFRNKFLRITRHLGDARALMV